MVPEENLAECVFLFNQLFLTQPLVSASIAYSPEVMSRF